MKSPIIVSVALALAVCANAARTPLQTFQCGAPNALCGASIPSGTSCPKGPGYCTPGYYCGWTFSDIDKATRCLPVPKDCGKTGNSCCPGNAVKAFTDPERTDKPTCVDGSYCFYTPTPDASGWSAPAYSSPAGSMLGTCRKVANDCGQLGKPCCPSLYHRGVNPAFSKSSIDTCGGNTFCQYIDSSDKNYKSDWPQGTCIANKPKCGMYGNSCCIRTGGVATMMDCGPAQWPAQGYCEYPGGKVTKDLRDQICTKCPGKQVVAANPGRYFPCPDS